MARNGRFVTVLESVNEELDVTPPLPRADRYAVAFRALVTSVDEHIRRAQNDEMRRYWIKLVFILNKIDERITAEAVGGEEL